MAKSAADGSLTFVKSAVPRDGTDFDFLFSAPIIPNTPAFLTEGGSPGSSDVKLKYPRGVAGSVYGTDPLNQRIQKVVAFPFVLDDADPDDGDAFGSSITFDHSPGTYHVTEYAPSGWGLDS